MSQFELYDSRVPLSARALALAFLSTGAGRPMLAAALIRRAAICGVDAPAMRVALGRLVRDGLVERQARSTYAIGPAGRAVDRLARGWADAAARVRPWHGRWIVVAVDHLGRSDRPRMRLRDRAFRLHGFARADSGLWVRADNLALAHDALSERLHALGLDPAATILGDAAALPADDEAFRALWPVAQIEGSYRGWIADMQTSLARLGTMPFDDAARETLLLGQSVIRAINLDPLLPGELIDVDLRTSMIDAMKRYDKVGKSFWSRVED